MEIKRIGEHQIRCALTEDEIRRMGFEIDEIIADTETTQRFMRTVLNLVETQGNINMEGIAPMVKAELLQDHSMAITFGGSAEASLQNLIETVGNLLEKLDLKKLKELHDRGREAQAGSGGKAVEKAAVESMVCALRFRSEKELEEMVRTCFWGRLPVSSLYKWRGEYCLLLDFSGFSKEEMRPFAFGTLEYDNGRCSEPAQIAHVREHGSCLIKEHAIERLLEL